MKFNQLISMLHKSSAVQLQFQQYSTLHEIDIPRRISRSPTDILKAIANIYQRDLTAAHYKYHDDPYLIPYSNHMKRSYALSEEAGRKAAQWIRQQHADLFQHKVADPMIEAYIPKPLYTEDSEVSEEVLLKLMDSAMVTDATTVYKALRKKGIVIRPAVKEGFLEFLCYYNAEDPISEEWIEERWFSLSNPEKVSNKWKSQGLIEELFNELKDVNHASYSAMIAGMCMHGDVVNAFKMYEEVVSKVIPLNVEAYNSLLSNSYLIRKNLDLMWILIKELLNNMNHMKVKPNVRTLNGILQSLSKMMNFKPSKLLALQTLSEFKSLNIEPSLATYFHLIEVFYNDKSKLLGLINEILNNIENKVFTIEDPKDTLFFARTMEVISKYNNKDLAYRLYSILLKGNNYNFIGDGYKESIFYRHYFFTLLKTEEFSKFMEIYDKLVPGIYVPEPAVTNTLLESIFKNMAWELLPRIWSDIKLFDQSRLSGVLENVLHCTSCCDDPSLYESNCKIAWDIWEKIETNKAERSSLNWTASLLGNLIITALKGNEKAKAHLAMDKLIRGGSSLMNEPAVEAMRAYIDCCIQDNNSNLAIRTIQYCDDIGFLETSKFAQKLNSSLDLNDKQREKLASIVGTDCLKQPTEVNKQS